MLKQILTLWATKYFITYVVLNSPSPFHLKNKLQFFMQFSTHKQSNKLSLPVKKIHIELLRLIHTQWEVVKLLVYKVNLLPDDDEKMVSFSKKLDSYFQKATRYIPSVARLSRGHRLTEPTKSPILCITQHVKIQLGSSWKQIKESRAWYSRTSYKWLPKMLSSWSLMEGGHMQELRPIVNHYPN